MPRKKTAKKRKVPKRVVRKTAKRTSRKASVKRKTLTRARKTRAKSTPRVSKISDMVHKRLDDLEFHVLGLHDVVSANDFNKISKKLNDLERSIEEIDVSHHARNVRTRADVENLRRDVDGKIANVAEAIKLMKSAVSDGSQPVNASLKAIDGVQSDNSTTKTIGITQPVNASLKAIDVVSIKNRILGNVRNNFNLIKQAGRDIVSHDIKELPAPVGEPTKISEPVEPETPNEPETPVEPESPSEPEEVREDDDYKDELGSIADQLIKSIDIDELDVKEIPEEKKPVVAKATKEDKFKQEYESYVNKYGREPTPGLLVMERLINKMDEKDPRPVPAQQAVIKRTARKISDKREVDNEPIDVLYETVLRRGRIKVREAARKLRVPNHTVERWAKVLEDHDLIKMHNSFFGGSELRKK